MAGFDVQVVIENKPGLIDPEGSTILEDLILKGRPYSGVTEVRTAKMLRFTVSAQSAKAAAATVRSLCADLRIYNPLVSTATVRAAASRRRAAARQGAISRSRGARSVKNAGRSGPHAGSRKP